MIFTSKNKELLAFTSGNGSLVFVQLQSQPCSCAALASLWFLRSCRSSLLCLWRIYLSSSWTKIYRTFLTLLGSLLLLLLDCITDVICFVDCSIQFLSGVDQPGEKSYIFQNARPGSKFQFIPQYGHPKMLTLESIRTETETSRGCKSPCIFIEVVLLFRFY
jgi:hypothetical protein